MQRRHGLLLFGVGCCRRSCRRRRRRRRSCCCCREGAWNFGYGGDEEGFVLCFGFEIKLDLDLDLDLDLRS
jgi:hypothetical protein